MPGLQPDPGRGERAAPVFFHIPFAALEIHPDAVEHDPSVQPLPDVDHPVTAFHAREKGERTHDSAVETALRIWFDVRKPDPAQELVLPGVVTQFDALPAEPAAPDPDVEASGGRPERLRGIPQIGDEPAPGVDRLNERVRLRRLPAERDAGDQREHAGAVRADQLVVPALEIIPASVRPLIDFRIPEMRHVRLPSCPRIPARRGHACRRPARRFAGPSRFLYNETGSRFSQYPMKRGGSASCVSSIWRSSGAA